ncbi:hypothetical protein [Francisella philomiragia]|uniref:hypothetical protein n=1 Tax=Francisella philomiragia TaxID=28110 RepID=UPI0022436E58|nr:hypothetical protein [Francisella philomiragia]
MSKLSPLFKACGIDVIYKGNKLRALQSLDKTQAQSKSHDISLRINNNKSMLRFEVDPELKDGDIIELLDDKYRAKQTRKVSIFNEFYWDVEVELQQTTKKGSIYD